MHKFIAKSRGYTLVELVVALTLIILISVVGLSVVYTSTRVSSNVIIYAEAQNFCDNVWESYKASRTKEEFLQNVAFVNEAILQQKDEKDGYTYFEYIDQNRFVVNIKVSFDNDSNILINAIDTNGKEILCFSFVKGGL